MTPREPEVLAGRTAQRRHQSQLGVDGLDVTHLATLNDSVLSAQVTMGRGDAMTAIGPMSYPGVPNRRATRVSKIRVRVAATDSARGLGRRAIYGFARRRFAIRAQASCCGPCRR